MAWHAVDAPEIGQELILFDGDCVLCSGAARFVHRRDGAMRFKFVAIQSEYGRWLAQHFAINPDAPETNVAIVRGRAYFKLDAPIAILEVFPGWRWVGALKLAPRGLRNWVYDRIARNRYAWFGRTEQCWAGDPAFRARILERAP
jgi:predicted DCC family thiol-disulfide oxidoreductase YuxK